MSHVYQRNVQLAAQLRKSQKAGWSLFKENGELIVCKRDFSAAKRKEAASSGAAMSDGSYPIENADDLSNAIRLSGMSNHPASEVKAHIKSRAKALGLESKIPDDWGDKVDKSEPKPAVKKAGIEVTTQGDPEYGIYAHQLGGKQIGHTVKAVHDGTIGWTAVPTNGRIKGKFKSQEEGKQYLADQHAEGMKQEVMQEQAARQPKPVKKDDEETGDQQGSEAGSIPKDWLAHPDAILYQKDDSPGTDNGTGDEEAASSEVYKTVSSDMATLQALVSKVAQ